MNPRLNEYERLLSVFIHELTVVQVERSVEVAEGRRTEMEMIPRRIVRYWHDPSDVPQDVRVCLDSWNRLENEGFEFYMFDDSSAAVYIADAVGEREYRAFARCIHPAMRSDYLRMCFILVDGGLYVDADEVLLGDDWRHIFRDGRLKVQPLCYDMSGGRMVSAAEIWQPGVPLDGRIFYVNNNPIAAPANHPVVRRALMRATDKLLGETRVPEIQSTTGPGNFTVALAAHARQLKAAGLPYDFELLRDWNSIAETRWDLSYRADARNWRNVFGC